MKNLTWVTAACVLLTVTAWGDQQAARPHERYLSATYGFAIDPPAFDALHSGHAQYTAMFYGPGENPTPSVKIQIIQGRLGMTLEDYTRAAVAAQEKSGLKVLARETRKVSGRDALLIEAAGGPAGRETHSLCYYVLGSDRTVAIICTASPAQFETLRDRFMACLDSFQLTGENP